MMSRVPPVVAVKTGCCCFGLKTARSYKSWLAAVCLVWATGLDCQLLPGASAVTQSILHIAASLLLCCI